jgi:hypothetical protein
VSCARPGNATSMALTSSAHCSALQARSSRRTSSAARPLIDPVTNYNLSTIQLTIDRVFPDQKRGSKVAMPHGRAENMHLSRRLLWWRRCRGHLELCYRHPRGIAIADRRAVAERSSSGLDPCVPLLMSRPTTSHHSSRSANATSNLRTCAMGGIADNAMTISTIATVPASAEAVATA